MNNTPSSPAKVRIAGIDALRGFDMFWITGGLPLFMAAWSLFFGDMPAWLRYHTTHVAWEGFAAWDLIMPLFLFIVGASMPFSFSRKEGVPRDWMATYFRIVKRVLVLFVFGMIAQGNLLSFNPDHIKLFSNTLQAIAGGYLISSIALLHLGTRGRVVLLFALLLVYWALLRFVPFGGNPGGMLEPGCNIALYWDRLLQGGMQDGTSYTWIVSQLAFGAMTLTGVLGGEILKCGRFSGIRKLSLTLAAGGGCLFLGYVWSLDIPIIKHLFTSSMVLWAAGWCYLLLGAFYFFCDVLHWERLFFPFKVVGSNAIFVYMWVQVCSPEGNISRALFGGFSHLFGRADQFVFLLCNYLLIWGVLYFLYRKKVFIKV